MSGFGLPEGVVLGLIFLAIVYGILLFCLPLFVYTIRLQSIRTNQLLEKILKRMNGMDDVAVDYNQDSVSGPVTCEICDAQVPIKDYVPHMTKCMQNR